MANRHRARGRGGRIIGRSPWVGSMSFYDPGPSTVTDPGENDRAQRALAYIMNMPVPQRAGAYLQIFGHAAPAGLLDGTIAMHGGDGLAGYPGEGLVDAVRNNPLLLVGGVAAIYFLFFRKKGR